MFTPCRGSNPCKDGNWSKRWNVVNFCKLTAYSSGELAYFHRIHRISPRYYVRNLRWKTNFSSLLLHIFTFFSRPGIKVLTYLIVCWLYDIVNSMETIGHNFKVLEPTMFGLESAKTGTKAVLSSRKSGRMVLKTLRPSGYFFHSSFNLPSLITSFFNLSVIKFDGAIICNYAFVVPFCHRKQVLIFLT